MVTTNWKELERHVATKLGGTRPKGRSWTESAPDVLVDQHGQAGLPPDGYMVVECKYSIYQPWQQRADEIITDHALKKGEMGKIMVLTSGHNLIMWDLEDTHSIIRWITTPYSNLIQVFRNFQVIDIKKKPTKFIEAALNQAELYRPWVPEKVKFFLPAVCLGQKGAHRRIMVCRNKMYEEGQERIGL